MKQLTCGSLFAGIGGFDLGFERAGIKTIWQVEIDEYCRRVLAKHFPEAERFEDVREVGARNLRPVDIVCGGFPCQDISSVGSRAGIDGEKSGLWKEMRRIVCELRPRFVAVENVAALLNGGVERVLADLAESGYDAEWDCLPASAFGAPHQRDRIFIVAYPASRKPWESAERKGRESFTRGSDDCGRAEKSRREISHTASERLQNRIEEALGQSEENPQLKRSDWWIVEPNVGRVAHGVSRRVDRLRALGNAIVPQIAEWIGSRIVATESALTGTQDNL